MLHVGEDRADLGRRLDAAYDALMATASRHYARRGGGWHLMGVAGLDTPTMNRASIEDAPVGQAREVVEQAYAFFGERGVPWSVVLSSHRPQGAWHGALFSLGFTFSSVLHVLARPPGPLPARGDLAIREVGADEVGRFTDILVDVFHMPRRFYPALCDMSDAWRRHGARLYFGLDDDGEPVATALAVDVDGVAGVYNVGTLRRHRRKGYARELMARAFDDMRDVDVVTLQVSPGGVAESFYLRMGFEHAHAWRFYAPGPRTPSLMTRWNESPG